MGSWDGLNRRKFPRINYPCQVVIRQMDNRALSILTHTENVGIGGVGVMIKQEVPVFTPVDLEIDLMDFGEHLKCKGKIVWVIPRKESDPGKPRFYDVGIEYVGLDEAAARRVQGVVEQLSRHSR